MGNCEGSKESIRVKRKGGHDEEGQNIQDDEELKEAFVRHNLKTEPTAPEEYEDERVPIEKGEEEGEERQSEMIKARRAIKTIKNKSAAGPDGVLWRLLKMIAKKEVGRQIERDVARFADIKHQLRVPESWREMIMVMIPKLAKDHRKVKGWRPIVLANTVGKWCEKIVGQDLWEQ